MRFWKDKKGLKTEASEPTVLDEKLQQLNQLSASIEEMDRRKQWSNNQYSAKEAQYHALKEVIAEQGVLPRRQENGVWTLPVSDEKTYCAHCQGYYLPHEH